MEHQEKPKPDPLCFEEIRGPVIIMDRDDYIPESISGEAPSYVSLNTHQVKTRPMEFVRIRTGKSIVTQNGDYYTIVLPNIDNTLAGLTLLGSPLLISDYHDKELELAILNASTKTWEFEPYPLCPGVPTSLKLNLFSLWYGRSEEGQKEVQDLIRDDSKDQINSSNNHRQEEGGVNG